MKSLAKGSLKARFLITGTTICGTLVLAGCAASTTSTTSSSSSTGQGSGITKLVSLPKTTGKMASTSTRTSRLGRAEYQSKATTGTKIADWGTTGQWVAGKSRAMCESGSVVRDLFRDAATPDLISCYVASFADNSVFTGLDSGFKLYHLDFGGGSEIKVKLKYTKATDGSISGFEMFACSPTTAGSSTFTQDQYILQSLGSTVALTSVYKGSFSVTGTTMTFGNRSTATGSINSSGEWTSKEVTGSSSMSFTGDIKMTSSTYGKVTQFADALNLEGYMKGTYAFLNGTTAVTMSFNNQMFGVMQAMAFDKPTTAAIGDGSMKTKIDFTVSNNGVVDSTATDSMNDTFSWNGDTRASLSTASSGDYYTAASAGTLPTASTVTISFSSSEAFDCSGTFEKVTLSSLAADLQTKLQEAMTACTEKYQNSGNTAYVDCQAAN